MIVVDGENCILGRMSAKIAKELIGGEEVNIVNAEKIVILGKPDSIVEHWKGRFAVRDIGKPVKSPKLSRRPDLFVKRSVRGMLPHRKKSGIAAHRRLMAHIGVPKQFEGKGIKYCELKDEHKRRITIEQLCKKLGWKG